MEDEMVPKQSPLSQKIKSRGKAVQIEIYGDEGEWILEAVDEFNNSTVWDEPFKTDVEAFAEAQRTVREDGIESLIGPRPQKA